VSRWTVSGTPRLWPTTQLDIRRANAHRNLTFGFGIHRCLGQHLALTELRVLLERTLDLLDDLAFDPAAPPPRRTGLGFRMPTALPVRFRAVQAPSLGTHPRRTPAATKR